MIFLNSNLNLFFFYSGLILFPILSLIIFFKLLDEGIILPEFILSFYYKRKIGYKFIHKSSVEWTKHGKSIDYSTLEEIKDGYVLVSSEQKYTTGITYRELQIKDFYRDYKATKKVNKSSIFKNELGEL